MKTNFCNRPLSTRRNGFTLIEILVVLSIIVILAAISITGFNMVQEKQNRKTTEVRIKLLETKLEEYKLDNGTYPNSNIAGVGQTNGDEKSSQAIAVALSGRNLQGAYPDGNDVYKPKIYWSKLKPDNDQLVGDKKTVKMAVLDAYGQPLRYRVTEEDGDGNKTSESVNPDFDLWSIGPDGETNKTNPDADENADDIRNF